MVLAAKIEYGQYTRNDALAVARAILYETPRELLGMHGRRRLRGEFPSSLDEGDRALPSSAEEA